MLVRRKIDADKTVRTGRQEWPQYAIVRQEFMLDPWEDDDVMKPVCAAFQQSEPETIEGWHTCPGGSPFLPRGEHLVRIMEDPETGYIYYRSPTDLERSQKWNADRTFRVTAATWNTDNH